MRLETCLSTLTACDCAGECVIECVCFFMSLMSPSACVSRQQIFLTCYYLQSESVFCVTLNPNSMKSNQLPRVRHTEQRGINAILLFNPCRHCCFGKMYPTGRIGLSVCCHLPSNASPSRLPHERKHSVPRERDKVVRTGCINRIRS